MERLENLTLEQLELVSKTALAEGYNETVSIENIPIGSTSCKAVIITVAKKRTPAFALIKFERKDKDGNELKLKFEAVKLDVLHLSSGKSYNGIYAKVTPELKTALTKPENYSKEMLFESVAYVDSSKRERTILKFDSISK